MNQPTKQTSRQNINRSDLQCFCCSKTFHDRDGIKMHEKNDHKIEFHNAMINEIYGGYGLVGDFEENS